MSRRIIALISGAFALIITTVMLFAVHGEALRLLDIRFLFFIGVVPGLVFASVSFDLSNKGAGLLTKWWLGALFSLLLLVLFTVIHGLLFQGSGGWLYSVAGQLTFSLLFFGWIVIVGAFWSLLINYLLDSAS